MKRILLVLLMLITVMPLAVAASENPVTIEKWKSGNAEFECSQLDHAMCDSSFAFKIDDWGTGMNGTYEEANIVINNSDSYTFEWNSESPVCAVIVKGGQGANVYYYDGVYTGTGLVAPEDKEISHVTFCFTEEDGGIEEIPEFPTVALPIAAILGLAFFMQRRKE